MNVPTVFSLDDRYTTQKGRVFLSGVQALVRLPLIQAARDRAQGLNTAGFISGYRGSPLGGLDGALWRAKTHLEANRIHFQPAVNEELAATAIIGSQQANLYDDAAHDGVFAIWYGKGPGADRAGDAMKHANSLGASNKGGALAVIGDDPGAVSSSLAHQCEQLLMSWMMPLLFPASVHEYVDYGLLGLAMSRYSGCYTGFKAVSEVVETAASINVDPDYPHIVMPEDFDRPPEGLGMRWPDLQLEQEARLQTQRLPAAKAFARANRIDRVVMGERGARIGLVAAGKAYQDLMQALADLGIDQNAVVSMGLSVYKIGMVWPLEPTGARAFVRGLDEVIVIEEKRAFIESQLKELLYNLPADERPRILGKADETGAALLPTTGEMSPEIIARMLARRLPKEADQNRIRTYLEFLDQKVSEASQPPPAMRPPIFCSGCPHNVSTRLPEGSRALVGTGCHLIAAFLDRKTDMFIQMGGEGAHWVGQEPFCSTDHIFQNLGDGTYVHSGYMALRQALAAGTPITYKILFNDAVAMTGGQPFEGGVSVPQITRQVHAEGVRRIAVVTPELDQYPAGLDFAPGVTFHARTEMDELQRDLRDWPGVSVLIYDQVCATEKRRRRKQGRYPPAARRIFINKNVCEDCGDCVTQSSCVSVVPVQTQLGRKRSIDQSACNEDLSCLEGFCPSMVSLEGAALLTRELSDEDPAEGIEPPELARPAEPYGILFAGIGGEGVVTVGQILAMAAHIDGLECATLDFTGLAQKGGGVLTHLRMATEPGSVHVPRLPAGGANLLIASDMVAAAGPEALSKLRKGVTNAVINDHVMPIARNILDPTSSLDHARLRQTLEDGVGTGRACLINANRIAEGLAGDRVGVNIFLLGLAFQKGYLPVSLDALTQALELNGVAVKRNKLLFAWGRHTAHDP
ncbi:MAG: indolepyruvate ferredoxin oxidoreductase family protein, partial [Rhodospirillales bacterium]|nr:indolepyruvate ferredoxin oxidoreductase family protein [Rhodospirillales bacterium]